MAPRLLGLLLAARDADGTEVSGRIIEVEAYTSDDPASHSRNGPTVRNRSMFEQAGTLYVYLSYGIHRCLNVVTGAVGDGQAVLVRALDPVVGLEVMRRRRGAAAPARVADGPGKLAQALGVELAHDGVDLCDPSSPIRLVDDGTPPPGHPLVGRRIGITRATEVPWRWRIPPVTGR